MYTLYSSDRRKKCTWAYHLRKNNSKRKYTFFLDFYTAFAVAITKIHL